MCVCLTCIGADHQTEKGMKVHTVKEVDFFFLVRLFWMLQDAVIFASIISKKGRSLCALLCEAASLETRIEKIAPSLILLSSQLTSVHLMETLYSVRGDNFTFSQLSGKF